ncbi:MAG: hypothetical protein A4E57_03930 [Syntrophorhabdaceae bacterium PtaU1.Bin034]|nr:MAG: hypothetical protein A4E57_03930 [Syntrophorhabdaceae bacterium PtaU1.Bin034]
MDPNAPTVSRRTLRFIDGTQIALTNLHEIMVELYSVGKKPNRETVEEIIAGLEAMGNYISDSELVRREYRNVLLKEYEEFVETHDREGERKGKASPNTPEGKNP